MSLDCLCSLKDIGLLNILFKLLFIYIYILVALIFSLSCCIGVLYFFNFTVHFESILLLVLLQ